MAENIRGYEKSEVIRKNAGSPGVWYAFSGRVDTIMIDNLGSPGVYVSFSGLAVDTSSGNGFVPNAQFRVFDLRIGSVNVLSLTGSPSVQVIGLYD